ncbi:MAG: rod shape-determining protein RodA [Crocinitomicaceae bacterium]|nr:rod shape-determining protein RodA [Crocinitomicaceae bacterium]|tara:strand:+ start:816 stop:2111 length:1296 start_codon:yes stop_codon:yes gene_type:complete
MSYRKTSIIKNLDWVLVTLLFILLIFGWINIISATSNIEMADWLDWNGKAGKQLLWMGICTVFALVIVNIESEFFIRTSILQYLATLLMLTAVLIIGKKVGGARSWFGLGGFSLQPSEFAKPTTALALSWYISRDNSKWESVKSRIFSILIVGIPACLILLQPDAGTVLVFAGFVFVLYREGLSGNVLILGFAAMIVGIATILIGSWGGINWFWGVWILFGSAMLYLIREATVPRKRKSLTIWGSILLIAGLFLSVGLHTGMEKVLKPHQRERIQVLFGIDVSNPDADYNIRHAKAAIGSGGFSGKGWMNGPMTAYSFVPEQETDFIFCTIGEEWGFIGTISVVILFTFLLLRVIFIAERQRSKFTRVYAYGVASILFMHFLVNIGMVLGLAPVIGIPLPFFSYGGSSLLGFTFLFGVLLRLDGERFKMLR